ncbi:MAG: thioesterase family protein [Cyanobacteria bacterium J06581_3]
MNKSKTDPSAWFDYPVRVQPHHTDYGGVVWHGTYITWMESARIACIRAAGLSFEDLVKSGYDLPVVSLDLRYRRPLGLGMEAIVKTRLLPTSGIRLVWEYAIETAASAADASADFSVELCVSGTVTLVTVDVHSRKIVRRQPPAIQKLMTRGT